MGGGGVGWGVGRGPTLDPPLFFFYFCALHSWYHFSPYGMKESGEIRQLR